MYRQLHISHSKPHRVGYIIGFIVVLTELRVYCTVLYICVSSCIGNTGWMYRQALKRSVDSRKYHKNHIMYLQVSSNIQRALNPPWSNFKNIPIPSPSPACITIVSDSVNTSAMSTSLLYQCLNIALEPPLPQAISPPSNAFLPLTMSASFLGNVPFP